MVQNLHLSRTQKNKILMGILVLAFAVKLCKFFFYEIQIYPDEKLWMYFLFPILLMNTIPFFQKIPATIRHAALFLSTGGIIGITIGQLLKTPENVIVLEYIWLTIAIIGAILHYSTSKNDIYS